jgi:uncharacterized protein YggE
MKKLVSFLVLSISALLAVNALAETFSFTIPDAYLTKEQKQPVLLSVSGTGNVKTTPDRVVITANIYTQNKKASVAFDENQTKMGTLMDSLLGLGIPKEMIATQSLNISPVYKENSNKVDYFYVSRSIVITQDNLSVISPILDAIIDAGIEEVGSIQFVVKNQEEKYQEALDKAAADAKDTALMLVESMGAKIVGIQNISYDYGGGYYDYNRRDMTSTAGVMDYEQSYNQMIVPSQQTSTVNVYATYIIEYVGM